MTARADPGFPMGGGGGRGPVLGGIDLRHRCFLVKMYVKTKELGPVGGGGHAPKNFVCRSANGRAVFKVCLPKWIFSN